MNRFRHPLLVSSLTIVLALSMTQLASAQRRRRSFFGVNRVQLASLEKVQAELKLTEDQKKLAKETNEKLSADRRSLFQGGFGGDFEEMRKKMEKMNTEATAKLTKGLEDAQNKRLTELYVQLNGANALMDQAVAAALKVTEEQKQTLAKANDENRQAGRGAFQGFRDMSAEERTKAMEKLRKESDDRLLAALTKDQVELFGKMKGKEMDIDTSSLFPRRGGGGGRQGGGGRPARPQ